MRDDCGFGGSDCGLGAPVEGEPVGDPEENSRTPTGSLPAGEPSGNMNGTTAGAGASNAREAGQAEESARILAARAKALARVRDQGDGSAEGSLEVVQFLLAHEHYAIEAVYVGEVLPLGDLTAIPCTPPFVLGIINVRGRVLSVIDLKGFFDLPGKGLTNLNRVILIGDGDMEFGILADEVLGTSRIPRDRIQPALPTLTGIREQYLKGIAEGPVVILDAARVLADPGIVVNEDVEA